MICYTLSNCVLSNFLTNTKNKLIPALLWRFMDGNNSHKLIIDRDRKAVEYYLESAKDNSVMLDWIEYMGLTPECWELIDVENLEQANSEGEFFLIICSQTEDKMLIVYSHNGWTRGQYYRQRNIWHNNESIRILDRTETKKLLSLTEDNANRQISKYKRNLQMPIVSNSITNINNSVVAQIGSCITNVKREK
jgi:hypothetical protein